MGRLCCSPFSGHLPLKRLEGYPVNFYADFISAILIRATGTSLVRAHLRNWKSLGLDKLSKGNEVVPSGDIAALVYLWNPFTIVSCIGFNTSAIENMFVVMSLYGASAGLVPLAAFGWVVSSHLSLYPIVLVIPVVFLLGYGLDAPPRKLFALSNLQGGEKRSTDHAELNSLNDKFSKTNFSWWRVIIFFLWASVWTSYVLIMCVISMKEYGGLGEMFKRTYGFILAIEDLSPNIGVLWYFFAEVFDFFRNFFLIVFHVNILFMILPLAIRLNHRPCFLAFVYLAVSSMLKSYPSVGDSALYLSLLVLFVNELAEMQFTFFLFCGYVGISLLSPVMHNLWIWRGTGNANFYFATAIGYACFQIILVVESVSAMLNHDRKIRKLCNKV
ncbi:phosphatidylinositol glycan anchor biosynthesis class U protein-like isoform X2 [Salvia splendens]|uniref:phosphatidylinositol glycan anchor biosynthesis class U protein-like isoform X2 n=1 Tax=Salvia splendens TaxID=180675 RepID=UPI001C266029|nr:phosphatidylinositol glycan anchor biosynthesis class U protein-like isoform X2 [Salvia splendens]